MSASLVGSEMCIRDSSAANSGDGEGALRDSSPSETLERTAMHSGDNAVSYTHLTLPTICSV
eukprot:3242526-Alexandrium_andersonii.AAC.1